MNPLRALANLASAWVDAIAHDRIVYPAKPFDDHVAEALAAVASCVLDGCDEPTAGPDVMCPQCAAGMRRYAAEYMRAVEDDVLRRWSDDGLAVAADVRGMLR